MNLNIDSIEELNSEEKKLELLDYIGNDYIKVPYLYLDLEKYGYSKDNVYTWYYKKSNKDCCIFLLYFDCLHIYTRSLDEDCFGAILKVIDILKPHTIIAVDRIGEYLNNNIINMYRMIHSYVMDATSIPIDRIGYNVELAKKSDLVSIVDLFLQTEHYRNLYSKDILLKQFEQRYDDKFGRFFIVKDNNRVVGSLSTYGENDKFAIVSGLITDSSFKKPGVAVALEKYVSKVLKEESKHSVGFNSDENVASLKLALRLGCKKISDYYQFIRL